MSDESRLIISARIERKFPWNHPRTAALREHLISVCADLVELKLADPKFLKEIATDSEQSFWACMSEALVAARLRGKQFGSRVNLGAGPDFLLLDGIRKIWVEVVCPAPVGIPDDWLNPENNKAQNFPHEQILLRWTSAIKSKAEALIGSVDGEKVGYLKSGVVAPEDAYVIAVNGCQLRSGPFPVLLGISQYPFAVEAVFPVGPIEVRLDRKSNKIVDRGYQFRPYVINKNGAQVPANTFLDERFNPISAIWALDLNGGSAIGNAEPTAVIHNPNACNPIPIGFLPADNDFVARSEGDAYVLTTIPWETGEDFG